MLSDRTNETQTDSTSSIFNVFPKSLILKPESKEFPLFEDTTTAEEDSLSAYPFISTGMPLFAEEDSLSESLFPSTATASNISSSSATPATLSTEEVPLEFSQADQAELQDLINSAQMLIEKNSESLNTIEKKLHQIKCQLEGTTTLHEISKKLKAIAEHASYSSLNTHSEAYKMLVQEFEQQDPLAAKDFQKRKQAIQKQKWQGKCEQNIKSAATYRLNRKFHETMIATLLTNLQNSLANELDTLDENQKPAKKKRCVTTESGKINSFSLFSSELDNENQRSANEDRSAHSHTSTKRKLNSSKR